MTRIASVHSSRGARRLGIESLESRHLLVATPLITEFMADNTATLFNELAQGFPDWIEIYNPGPGSVDLQDWYLTDRKNELHTWQFLSSVVLEEGDFLLVWASGLDIQANVPEEEWHTNFRLGRNGEYLALVRADGTTVASEYEPTYPPQSADVSFGLTSEFNDVTYFETPTPGEPNPPDFKSNVFSPPRGIYSSPILVSLNTAEIGENIRYTTNGSVPTEADASYGMPLNIDTTTTLRVKAFGAEADGSVHTQTYLFLDDVIQQPAVPAGLPQQWTDAGGAATSSDYEFDPDIARHPSYVGSLVEGFVALPSMFLTIDPVDLFDTATGIYVNPLQSGGEWERPVSIEMIFPDGAEDVAVEAGIRIRGGDSRDPDNTPKHSFRVSFKSEFGPTVLKAELFPDSTIDEFDRLEINAALHDGWLQPTAAGRQQATMLRDQWLRDSHRDMGQPVAHGRDVHLYLNGLYWGVYNLKERLDRSFAEIRFGGAKSDYDVIDAGELKDGQIDGWNAMMALAAAGLQSDQAYTDVQQYLDVDSFIDFAIARIQAGDTEWGAGGWFAIRNRDAGETFRFYVDRSEQTLGAVNADVWQSVGDESVMLFDALRSNPQFRRRFGDRVNLHFFNDGALQTDRNIARWMVRSARFHEAVVNESARWGDYRRDVQPSPIGPNDLYTRDDHWQAESDRLVQEYFPARNDVVLTQFQQAGLFPTVRAPQFSQYGGEYTRGFELAVSAPEGTIIYTTNGIDPLLPNGQVSPHAQVYVDAIPLTLDVAVKARALVAGQPSALTVARFFEPTTVQISEVMFHSADDASGAGLNDDEFDFIEIMNVGDETVDLTGMSFSSGVRFDFSTANVTQLEAGQLAVVVRDREAFSLRYDATNILIAGQYSGRLNNSGERIVLTGSLGQVLAEVAYKDDWYDITDGEGFSLVRRQNEVAVTSASDAEQWRPSHYRDGSPGSIDPGYNPGSVVISEALTHNDVPVGDWLELHNTTANDIDISGWYISARPSEPTQYQIPEGTVLKAGGYLVFTANEHPDSPEYGGSMGFAISKLGEKVLITSSGRATELGGYRIEVDFTYGFNATTFIRHTNSTGQVEYVLGLVRTRGLPNALPAVDRIRDHNNVYPEAVISEIMYHPAAGGDEYIELFNPHSQPVRLAKPFSPSWRFTSGVFYIFEDDVAIPTKTYALVVPIDPDEFRAKYNVPAETQIFGPYDGELLNSGERLTVSRAAEAAAFVPFSMTDQVFYNHPSGQWPQEANGLGASLNRVSYRAYGNDVENWRAGAIGGTPGRPNVDFVADARVVERMLFYNDSYFDGYDADVFSSHNEAIAPDRFALLAGQRATITNYSNYDKGLNGVIVDIQNMPGTPTVADFQFRVGNDNSPGGWQPAPDPSFFYVRPSGGVNGSDRIEFAWEEGVIRNMWLEVTVLPTANTGLAAADVHYWGNAVGDIGNSLFEATVNEIDATFLANNLNVDFDVITRFDINRDLSVNQIDIDIVNANFVDASGAMVMLDLRGDFNGDRFTDAKDLDALSQTIAAQSTAARFDLNGDGAVTLADQSLMIEQLLLTRPGDANLDRDVDSGDLNTVGRNWRMEVESWSQGDFNGDRVVNAADLNLLALNWRHGVPAAAPAARMPRAPLAASRARLSEFMLPFDSQLDSTQGEGGDSLSTGIPDENVDDSVDEDVVDPPDYSTPADPNRGLPIDENPANDDEWMFSELVDDVLARWATSEMRLIVPTSRRA